MQRKDEVFFNTKIKIYRDGSANVTYCNYHIFKSKFDVDVDREKNIEKKYIEASENSKSIIDYINASEKYELEEFQNSRKFERKEKIKFCEPQIHDDSVKRAKDKIFDIVYQNDWNYFLTITFGDEVDSFNVNEVMKKLRSWLMNKVQRKGLKYLLVPEEHKSGRIHCHALINDVLCLTDSGTKLYKGIKKPIFDSTALERGFNISDGRIVFNVDDWHYGFSTAIAVDDNKSRLAFYITKYVTKDVKKLFGKFYWSSKNIIRDVNTVLENTDFISIENEEVKAPNSLNIFKYDTTFTFEKE